MPGRRHRAHCSTAPAGSRRLLPEPREPPNFPARGPCPGVLRQHAGVCPFGQSNNSQCPFCGSRRRRTGCSACTPTALIPAHPRLLLLLSRPPPAGAAPSERAAPLPRVGMAPRQTGSSHLLPNYWDSGCQRSPRRSSGAREAVGSHDLLHRSTSVRSLPRPGSHCRTARPPPRPPGPPQTLSPGPAFLPSPSRAG